MNNLSSELTSFSQMLVIRSWFFSSFTGAEKRNRKKRTRLEQIYAKSFPCSVLETKKNGMKEDFAIFCFNGLNHKSRRAHEGKALERNRLKASHVHTLPQNKNATNDVTFHTIPSFVYPPTTLILIKFQLFYGSAVFTKLCNKLYWKI